MNEGGPADMIEDGKNGLLVPPRDPHQLARAIVIVLRDPAAAEVMGRAA
jgi:glycogen(starch) synthase